MYSLKDCVFLQGKVTFCMICLFLCKIVTYVVMKNCTVKVTLGSSRCSDPSFLSQQVFFGTFWWELMNWSWFYLFCGWGKACLRAWRHWILEWNKCSVTLSEILYTHRTHLESYSLTIKAHGALKMELW